MGKKEHCNKPAAIHSFGKLQFAIIGINRHNIPPKNANPKTIKLPLNLVQGASFPNGVVIGFLANNSTNSPAAVSKAMFTSPHKDFSRFFLACKFRRSNNSSETAMPGRPVLNITNMGFFAFICNRSPLTTKLATLAV